MNKDTLQHDASELEFLTNLLPQVMKVLPPAELFIHLMETNNIMTKYAEGMIADAKRANKTIIEQMTRHANGESIDFEVLTSVMVPKTIAEMGDLRGVGKAALSRIQQEPLPDFVANGVTDAQASDEREFSSFLRNLNSGLGPAGEIELRSPFSPRR